MPLSGVTQVTVAGGGGGDPDHFIVDTNDDSPRAGGTGTFYAQLVDKAGNGCAVAGRTCNWTLYGGAGASLGAPSSQTDDGGMATVTVSYTLDANYDDVFQVGADLA